MSLAKDRLRKVFNFLKQLNELRNPTRLRRVIGKASFRCEALINLRIAEG